MSCSRSICSISSQAFQPMLRESIDRFLLEHQAGSKDFSNFCSIFTRILQISPDPPLEIVWFYSALTYHTTKFCVQDLAEHVSRVKDLFQLLVSCSSSSSAAKKIAVLAPVLYELHHLVIDRKSLNKEIESFLEVIISYVCICSSSSMESETDNKGEDEGIILFEDLIRVWTVDKSSKDVRSFFPIISDELREGIKGGCRVFHLAGIVMSEGFLLKLCLNFDTRVSRAELDQDMRSWVIRTVGDFQNLYFLDNLLRMLLEPALPVSSLLTFEQEVFLREVIYDSVLTLEYPFISPINPCKKHLKTVAVLLLLVAESAIRFFRETGDNSKANTLANALSKSYLISQLLNWVTSQTGEKEITTQPAVSSPAALIKWLLIVEDLGVEVFDGHKLKLHAKAVVCKSRVEYELPPFNSACISNEDKGIFLSANSSNSNGGDKFKDDIEMVDSSVVHERVVCDATRKRKDGWNEENEVPMKLVKFHAQENVAARCGNGVDKLGFNGDALEMEF